jgi:precorrin-6B methylase 2
VHPAADFGAATGAVAINMAKVRQRNRENGRVSDRDEHESVQKAAAPK